MKTVKLTQDLEHEGLCADDVLSVDDFSAASMIERGVAAEYDAAADTDTTTAAGEPARYGGQEARTIDDIRDPQAARNRRVMNFTTVAAPDPGPVSRTVAEAESTDVADTTTGDDVTPEADTPPAPSPSGRNRPARGRSTDPELAAPAANAAGGDAGGGDGR